MASRSSHYLQRWLYLSWSCPRDKQILADCAHPSATRTHLLRSLRLDEFLIDLLCPLCHLSRRLDLLVVLTGKPELEVLLTELRLQETFEIGKGI